MTKISRFAPAAKPAAEAAAGDTARAGRAAPAWRWLAGAWLLLCLSLAGWPVETLDIERRDGGVWRSPVPLGWTVTTRYIHSVERTPVEDVYYPFGGLLQQWRTRSRSHNAGLPWRAPEHGRFVAEGNWLVLEGGLPAWEAIRLRVGSEALGHNELKIGSGDWIALYARFPGERLTLSAGRVALGTL